ncbi:MAG: hypothetical protein ACE1ZN_02935, partial [Dehalococcoidia bacterium]
WYFCGDSKKPLCKAIWLVCERHAIMLSDEEIVSRIQVLPKQLLQSGDQRAVEARRCDRQIGG